MIALLHTLCQGDIDPAADQGPIDGILISNSYVEFDVLLHLLVYPLFPQFHVSFLMLVALTPC